MFCRMAQKVEVFLDFLCYFIRMKMKKILLLLLQNLFLLGSLVMLFALYILRYFTKRKMGMARYMLYFREKWSGKELAGFSLLQWVVFFLLLFFALCLFLMLRSFLTQSEGKIFLKGRGKTYFPLIPSCYSLVLMLYSFLYFFSLVGNPGREYTASILVHLLMQFFSILFLATFLKKDKEYEK